MQFCGRVHSIVDVGCAEGLQTRTLAQVPCIAAVAAAAAAASFAAASAAAAATAAFAAVTDLQISRLPPENVHGCDVRSMKAVSGFTFTVCPSSGQLPYADGSTDVVVCRCGWAAEVGWWVALS